MDLASLISLKRTIIHLRDSYNISHKISLLNPSEETLVIAYNEFIDELIPRLEGCIERLDKKEIEEAACKLEDEIETHLSNQFLSQYESLGGKTPSLLSLDFEEVVQAMYSFKDMVEKKLEETEIRISDLLSQSDSDDLEYNAVSSTTDFEGNRSKMVGFSDEFNKIKGLLTKSFSGSSYHEPRLVSLIGMAGIGKTTLAREIYEDPSIASHFELRAFVTVGQEFELERVLVRIMTQMNQDMANIDMQDVGELLMHMESMGMSLSDRRCLIVLDDLWYKDDIDGWNNICTLKTFLDLAITNNESRILLISRQHKVGASDSKVHEMRFLNKEESWDLLCEKVFGEDKSCPSQLKRAGKKIAENCEGLPLTIVIVARLLLEAADMTPEYWKMVAEKQNSIFRDAYDEMWEVLFRSYNFLEQYLKVCFLYMGVFPPTCKIPSSKLIKLWSAERILDMFYYSDKEFGMKCLRDLVSDSVVICHEKSSYLGIKICRLHSAFWHFCLREAGTEKLFHVIDSYVANGIVEDIQRKQRLCIYKNVLFAIEEVCNSIESVSMARSLLCTGPYHKYPVPICLDLRLLRALEALTIRFFEFPVEVVKLVHLRYLALTSNGNVPTSISRLWKLEYLIVNRHLSIKPSEAPSYLPMEIWDMKELKHLQVMGNDLPEPDPSCDELLNLITLLDVSAHSCTHGVLQKIPKLKKLGIQIELAPDAAESLSFFDHLKLLDELESLKCVIVISNLESQVVAFPPAHPIFARHLRKLSLSGSGYPPEYMRIIAEMEYLEVLKLKSYAFEEPNWKINEREFNGLKCLLLEDCDLVNWIVDDVSSCFLSLQRLIMRHCYKLKEIPSAIGEIRSLQMIELVDCPLAVPSAKKIQEQHPDVENGDVRVCIHSSWLEKRTRKFA